MDRLNQLRGDAGASRDSTLDTSSLLGEGYVTANDSSKYFSLSEVDSSTTVSPSKEAANDVTSAIPIPNADRIISDLSPIPKKNELDGFKIGEQIEAANILSGGVNIFDDNENSYDGDELVIDDAVTEGDDKPAELKMSENAEVTFDKTDRLTDASMEDADAGIPTKDTEVVLQIDGKNVDAIDIGNGLYLYRKDGEEELAAVQILDNNQQQPDIKFLKVRENAEGNLEVYEEIEIEVPKELPTKEGKAVKNTSHIPVKDVNKISEPIIQKVTEHKSQAVPKGTVISEVESDINKDNAHVDSRTEVNLNGKMMKFSESRKSPLISTFTPMTYHSTPNKEGIPLTKTMVDLQLHPSRHSENVKKTIEVHTDNCKQRLLESPTKCSKDSNENKRTELVSTTSDKDLSNYIIADGIDQTSRENKNVSKLLKESKSDELFEVKINENKNKLENQQSKLFDENNVESNFDIKGDKTEIRALDKPLVTEDVQCKSNTNLSNEQNILKTSMTKTLPIKMCSKVNNEIVVSTNEIIKDDIRTTVLETAHSQSTESNNTSGNNIIPKVKEWGNENVAKDKETLENKEKITDDVVDENQIIIDNNTPDGSVSNSDKNLLKATQSITTDSIESSNYVKQSQNDLEIKDVTEIKQLKSESVKEDFKSELNINQENKQASQLLRSSSSTADVNLVTNTEIKVSENQSATQISKGQSDDENIKMVTLSESVTLQKGMGMFKNPASHPASQKKPVPEESATSIRNSKSVEIEKDSLVLESKLSDNILHNLPKELKTVSQSKQEEKECEDKAFQALQIKTNTELKLSNHENKVSSVDHQSSKNLNKGDLTEVRKVEIENKKKLEKLPDAKDAKLIQEDEISTVVTDVSKSASNTERTSQHKDSLTSGHNFSQNTFSITKASIAEKAEVQKKNECTQKLLTTNTKVPLLISDLRFPRAIQSVPHEIERSKNDTKKESVKVSKGSLPKPINNNKAAVPFGKWTEVNRQEFLTKLKESKVPINTSNTKQLKQPNDLNRRDVLKKIDSQRLSNIASTKVQDLNIMNKIKHKQETAAFASNVTQKEKLKDTKVSPTISKTEDSDSIPPVENTIVLVKKGSKEVPLVNPIDMLNATVNTKKDSVQRKEINNQDLIDKTIEGIINRAVTAKSGPEDVKQDTEAIEKPQNTTPYKPVSLDEIESKMNELHGIPFVERPPHELPKVFDQEHKQNVITSDVLIPTKIGKPSSTSKTQQKNEIKVNQSIITRIIEESDEEIIEHEPLTGDVELNKNIVQVHAQVKDKIRLQESSMTNINCDSKKEPIITENDFDKFARRNSITYENCLTVNFDGKEHHNVIQTIIEREVVPKKLSRNEIMLAESKAKSHKQLPVRHMNFSSKIPTTTKTTKDDDSYNKSYQSKVQIAYQSVMTAKRQQECPITIIEDKPVEVVFMDGNHEYIPYQLNVQGKELSPPKKSTEWDHFAHSNSESLDSDILDASNDSKSQDDIKFKSKHQRKQVLTPVETPELELIEPGDLGIEVSPKKKRKIEEAKPEKKSLVPKKCYLLNRNIPTDDAPLSTQDLTKPTLKESVNQQDVFVKRSDPISAIDNLVKAAELLETQSENKNSSLINPSSSILQNSPIKRGRGRPRKYPLPDSGSDKKGTSPVKTPTPQKKPRLIDAKISKQETESEDEEINSDGELVKENWTMGKINENIICPICSKLFRSENVVFKHVKHCTGPSPSRSDSDRSPRKMRQSQESDWRSEESKSDSMDVDDEYDTNEPIKKRKLKESKSTVEEKPDDKTDIMVEDIRSKGKDSPIRKRERLKQETVKTMVKERVVQYGTSLVCEFCGKTFRQLSYLVSHRLQHKSVESKKSERDHVHKFSCEICKKEFRKLHHLVQHRIIHNQNPIRSSRKSSFEQNDTKITKDAAKSTEDQSAGFRCEPCDKSFRKLHHLVEHRETHDEINKKCNPVTNAAVDTSKPAPLHHCNICKKTFKKLQHLIEHKEQHLDTSSEKSDDKSVKSSLSTKDIIHECPLCYMVFPNEHSLNKHHIICQRKKKQSAAKQVKEIEDNDIADTDDETKIIEASDENVAECGQEPSADISCVVIEDETPVVSEIQETNLIEVTKPLEENKEAELEIEVNPAKVDVPIQLEIDNKIHTNEKNSKITHKKDGHERNAEKVLVKPKKYVVPSAIPVEVIKITDETSKKKLPAKDRIGATVTKRQKTNTVPLPAVHKVKTPDSSDDDEIRYMLNPDFKIEESVEGKLFMKVRAKKRSSLQIERPNSKDLMKRRISLQHPPKIPRLKVKPIARKPINTNTVVKSSKSTTVPVEAQVSIDSDDSDVKYSFPEAVAKEMAKEEQKKIKRQKVVEKRKSLNGIAKRKSLGKMISSKQKVNPLPAKQIKKRTADAEHRCDCGQLFSSAALLTRHTSLAHTPPRIRRRRSPPPDNDAKPTTKRTEKPQSTRKTIDPPVKTGVTTRKSSVSNEAKTSNETRQTPKTASLPKSRRSAPHKGVPVPEKMRKVMDKSKK